MSNKIIEKTNTAVKLRLLFKGGQQAVALVMGILLARILSPAEFGVIAIVNMVVYYANNFTNFGLNNALVQKDEIQKTHINTVFTLDLIFSVILLVLTVLFAEHIAFFFHNSSVAPALRWMSLYYVITTFYHIPIVILRREIDFKFLTIIEFFEALLTSSIAIALALAGYSYWSIIIASLVMPIVTALILMLKTRWLPKIIIGKNMRGLYSFGLWSFIRAQIELIVSKIDYFVIGRYLDVQSLGIYEKSFELTGRAMAGLSMPLHGVFFSTFSRSKNDINQVKQIFLETSAILALICYPVLFGLIGVAQHFVMSCLGSQWEHAIVPIQILATASFFRVLLGNVANVNVAIGKYKAHTLINGISAAIFILLCFVFAKYGIVAISFASLFYSLLAFSTSFWLMCVFINVTLIELLRAIWCPLTGAVLMLFVVLSLRSTVLTNYLSFLQLLCLIIAGAIVYLGWCYFFYRRGLIAFSIKGIG